MQRLLIGLIETITFEQQHILYIATVSRGVSVSLLRKRCIAFWAQHLSVSEIIVLNGIVHQIERSGWCSSCKQDYVVKTAVSARTQIGRDSSSSWARWNSRLHLEVGPKVSDLGVSHWQICCPHTGRILQEENIERQSLGHERRHGAIIQVPKWCDVIYAEEFFFWWWAAT